MQELDGCFGAGRRVVDEGGVPSDDGEVGRIIGDAGLENFLALAFREGGGFPANDLGDGVALRGQEFFGVGGSFDLADVEDEVVLLQPTVFVVGLDQCGAARSSFCRTTRLASFSKLVSEVQREESSISFRQSPENESSKIRWHWPSLDFEHDGALPEALAALTDAFDGSTEEVEEIEDLLPYAVRLAAGTGDLGTAQALAGHAALAAESEIPHRQANALYCRGLLDHYAPRLAAAEHYDGTPTGHY